MMRAPFRRFKLIDENRCTLEKFVQTKRINGQPEQIISSQSRIVTELAEFLNKPFKDATEQERARHD
jgi:hypothetical protein